MVWFAPIGWLALAHRESLPGLRPYRTIWLAAIVFWVLTLHWLRLPHPLNHLLLVILASYLACYLPMFIALSRIGVHRLRLPLWLVAPVVWTGLDWIRGNFMTGFLMGSLAHTQVAFPELIQLASFVGEYGITFCIILVATLLTQVMWPVPTTWIRRSCSSLAAVAIIITLLFYGSAITTVGHAKSHRSPEGPRVAIIQGHTLADWKADPKRQQTIMQEYVHLTQEAIELSQQQDERGVDLVIWPETAYRNPLWTVQEGYQPPAELFSDFALKASQVYLQDFVLQIDAAILTGIDRVHLFPDKLGQLDQKGFNSSAFMDRSGGTFGTYDKMHLVIMGEYVPFTDWIPALRKLTPMTGLATPGERPAAFTSEGMTYCPNICYETCVPHLIRRHMKELSDAGKTPDVLVNLTNDAWFWGSSELDMHLACGIFRAVEMRLPLLIAANGGLSAHVDPYGNVQQVTQRQQAATLLVDLPQRTTKQLTFYARWGDWFAGLCVICCMALAVVGWRSRQALPTVSRSNVT